MLTHTRNSVLCIYPSKCTHSREHTHREHTHREHTPGAVGCHLSLRRPGSSWGFSACSGHLVVDEGGESAVHSLPPPMQRTTYVLVPTIYQNLIVDQQRPAANGKRCNIFPSAQIPVTSPQTGGSLRYKVQPCRRSLRCFAA